MKITVGYDNYQESDPVFATYIYSGTIGYPTIRLNTILIDPTRMNKRVTSINVYAAYATNAVASGTWPDADNEYYLLYSFPVRGKRYFKYDTGWKDVPTAGEFYYLRTQSIQYEYYVVTNYTIDVSYGLIKQAESNSSESLASRLNHATSTTRSVLTPRYGVKLGRAQGAAEVVDVDDSTLAVSLLDGNTVNEEDNYPNVAVDAKGNKLRYYLTSTDRILALGVNNTSICVFKPSELETIDHVS